MNSKTYFLFGPEYGLSPILRGEPTINFRYTTFSHTHNNKNIHIVVHPQSTMPFMESNGLFINPGMSTFVELSQKEFIRLESPYSECQPMQHFTVLSKEYILEPNYCMEQCGTERVYDKCRCVSFAFGETAENYKDYCLQLKYNENKVNLSKAICEMERVNLYVKYGNLSCDRCPWNCRGTKYEMKTSQSLWPEPPVVRKEKNSRNVRTDAPAHRPRTPPIPGKKSAGVKL